MSAAFTFTSHHNSSAASVLQATWCSACAHQAELRNAAQLGHGRPPPTLPYFVSGST